MHACGGCGTNEKKGIRPACERDRMPRQKERNEMADTVWRHGGYVGVLEFDADELRNIADVLAPNDMGAAEMRSLADELDRLNRADF